MNASRRIGGWIVGGNAKRKKEKAVLVGIPRQREEWIPLSQIRDELAGCLASFDNPRHPSVGDGMSVELVVNPWFVELKRLPHTKPGKPRVPRSATISKLPNDHGDVGI